MNYEDASLAVERAWDAFFHELLNEGVSTEKIEMVQKAIDRKDGFYGVKCAVMEVLL